MLDDLLEKYVYSEPEPTPVGESTGAGAFYATLMILSFCALPVLHGCDNAKAMQQQQGTGEYHAPIRYQPQNGQ